MKKKCLWKKKRKGLNLKELGLIRDNGEDANSPNYKYTVNEWVNKLGQELGHSVQVVGVETAIRAKLGQDVGQSVQVVTEHKLAKDRVDICLATKDPKRYCNGFYLYSTKDPGSGKAFVVVKHNNPSENWMEN